MKDISLCVSTCIEQLADGELGVTVTCRRCRVKHNVNVQLLK